ncbi:flagellar biosynthesis protein FliO [Archangium gephyra]|uniref:Flagellar biosynthesis protein FliO n=1 Tax=Archangium gephyra TaxID=48 RepID=A0AAC8QG04_9BACT|nr:flagellar biosynthetic protein FliO [Archangium gephyra]AKJ06426.1 Major facilitator family transporter [Archangium gephyra]REG32261.1 flagellar biosynthesis protein FliO [Archangium gephyra]
MKTLSGSVSPRNKLLLALGLVLGLAVLAPLGGVSAAVLARGLLGAAALGGLGWWLVRRGRADVRFALTERMRVVSRTGLSQRCGLALVEVEGSRYLVAFGDSFAEIRRAHTPVRVKTRSKRRTVARSHEKETLS